MKDAMLHNFGYKTAFETGVYSPDFREATEDAPKYARSSQTASMLRNTATRILMRTMC